MLAWGQAPVGRLALSFSLAFRQLARRQLIGVVAALLLAPAAGAAATPRPDLVVTRLGPVPGPARTGSPFVTNVRVRNIGAGRATRSQLRLAYVGGGRSAVALGSVAVPALGPGQHFATSKTIHPPAVGPAGWAARLRACADAIKAVAETSERDNCLSKPQKVVPRPPSAPRGLATDNPCSSSVELDWTDTSANEQGFRLSISSDGTNFSTLSDGIGANATSFVVNALSPNTPYSFRVRAYNAGGLSSVSDTAGGSTVPSFAGPVNYATNGDHENPAVTLSWPVVPAAAGYTIYRGAVHLGHKTLVGSVPASSTPSFTDNPPAGPSAYYYFVKPVDAADNVLSCSDEVDVVVG